MATSKRGRAVARWLLTPLLIVIDRRVDRLDRHIAIQLQESRDRTARMEGDLEGIREYVRLLIDALPSNGSAAAHLEAAPAPVPAVPAPAAPAAPAAVAETPGEQGGFLDRLACPTCRSRVQVVPEIVTADGRIKHGHVPCPTCREVVGLMRDFRVDFHARGGAVPEHAGEPRVIPATGELRLAFDDSRLRLVGGWTYRDNRLVTSAGGVGDALEYRGRFTDALVRLVTHDRGGVVDFFVDGHLAGTAVLYSEHWFELPFTVASNLDCEEHVLRLQPRGTKDARAAGTEVLLREMVLWGPLSEPDFEPPQPLNQGNPYMPIFENAIADVPEGDLILEVGGGERRRLRPGYVNLEFLALEFANVYGDVHRLPFQDDTFQLVLAQAVFEHVANPFVAAAELIRVTRPGGLIVADVAFMQPLHAAPHHYFNMTPWGIEELFKSCQIVETDYYDGLAWIFEWMLRSVGAQHTVSEQEFNRVIDGIRAMEAKLSHADIRPAASGYYCIARKPVPAPAAVGAGARAETAEPTA